MQFGDRGGAVGYLVGELHQGLKYMFTMMNNARLSLAYRVLRLPSGHFRRRVLMLLIVNKESP